MSKRTQRPEPLEIVENDDLSPKHILPDQELSDLHGLQTFWCAGSWMETLYELMYDFRRFECTDPRDRIYAFLGLANDVSNIEFVPDYSSPAREVFNRLVWALITAHKHLLILNCKREFQGDGQGDQQSKVYSLIDQVRFHDIDGAIIDGTDSKPRKGWRRLSEG